MNPDTREIRSKIPVRRSNEAKWRNKEFPLKNCPFCGCTPHKEHIIVQSDENESPEHIAYISCLNCVGVLRIKSFPFPSFEEARNSAYALWNRRKEEDKC